MRRRLRVLCVRVQPVLVWDDDEELTDGPAVDAVSIPVSELDEFTRVLPGQLAELAERLRRESSEDQ